MESLYWRKDSKSYDKLTDTRSVGRILYILSLKEIRDRFYDLIVNCIPPDRIIKELLECLLNRT